MSKHESAFNDIEAPPESLFNGEQPDGPALNVNAPLELGQHSWSTNGARPAAAGSSSTMLALDPGAEEHLQSQAQARAAAGQGAMSGLAITFENVSYRVRSSRGKKGQLVTLLSGVNAFLAPGEMTAVLGPSGSGKTTLIDLLCGRKTVGDLNADSRILYGGRRPSPSFLRRHVGYVEQFDTLLSSLTVHDMLLYTAQLKHPRQEPLASKRATVQRLIQKLNLEDCQDTVIGSVMSRGISGGEAKRVNIGITLISAPSFLFLDEPTSGLDSYNAHSVMSVVKDLVRDGITICSTIHSPPPYTFALFDRMLVLQRGETAYFGPNGSPALAYFREAFPELRGPGPLEGVADFILDVTTQASRRQSAGEVAPERWGGGAGFRWPLPSLKAEAGVRPENRGAASQRQAPALAAKPPLCTLGDPLLPLPQQGQQHPCPCRCACWESPRQQQVWYEQGQHQGRGQYTQHWFRRWRWLWRWRWRWRWQDVGGQCQWRGQRQQQEQEQEQLH